MAAGYLKSVRPGWNVSSAGTSAVEGASASLNAQLAMAELGLDLSEHRARHLKSFKGRDFDKVFVMGPEHLQSTQEWGGALISSLSGDRSGVPDPYGGSLGVYRQTLVLLRRHLDNLRTEGGPS